MRKALMLAVALAVSGCVPPVTLVKITRPPAAPLGAQKVIIIAKRADRQSSPARADLEARLSEKLRKEGFVVKHYTELAGAAARFSLDMRGRLNSEVCRGDSGPSFEWMEVQVIDLSLNEVVAVLRAEGPTETCITSYRRVSPGPSEPPVAEPMFGTLLGDLARTLATLWADTEPEKGTSVLTL